VTRCRATGKRRFGDERTAEWAVVKCMYANRILHKRHRRETRWYACPACGGWHITSQP
jgi:hypothetical protein